MHSGFFVKVYSVWKLTRRCFSNLAKLELKNIWICNKGSIRLRVLINNRGNYSYTIKYIEKYKIAIAIDVKSNSSYRK